MNPSRSLPTCCGPPTLTRRSLLQAAGFASVSWLTPVAQALARVQERSPRSEPAKSVIVLWLQGGPSQLETFDPHPGAEIAAGTTAIDTSVPGIRLAKGFGQLAAEMQFVSLVRSVVSKEGDHERATYNMKTGFRPDPTLVHPSLGAIICHQLPDDSEIPRHISLLPGQWPARGGYLGDQYDAFKSGDPRDPIADVIPRVDATRSAARIQDLQVVEAEFARGRLPELDAQKTLHQTSIDAALSMMSSEQLRAFEIDQAPRSLRDEYGDTPFGRSCLAAVRLIEVGVRCVEVTLGGWDSHLNNHETQSERVSELDPAFAALLRDLRRRELLKHTVVLCGGEFGRTPQVNPAGGRDHWPHGFSVALAGGGIRGGQVVGQTSPEPILEKDQYEKNVVNPKSVEDLHATVLETLGIDFRRELLTPIGRPMVLSQGQPIRELLVG